MRKIVWQPQKNRSLAHRVAMSHVRFDLDETQASSTPSLTSLTRLSAFGGGARRMTFDAKRNPVGGAGTRKRPPLVPVDQNSALQDSPLKRHAVCNEDSFKDDAFSNDFRQQLLRPQVGSVFPPPQTRARRVAAARSRHL